MVPVGDVLHSVEEVPVVPVKHHVPAHHSAALHTQAHLSTCTYIPEVQVVVLPLGEVLD